MSVKALAQQTQPAAPQEGLMLPSEALRTNFVLPDTSNKRQEIVEYRAHCFLLENIALLLNTELLRAEVLDELPMCRLPHTQPWLYGMANRRGAIVPIFDLYEYLGIRTSREVKPNHKYLLVELEEGTVGMLVERLPVRVTVSQHNKINLPKVPEKLQEFARDCFIYKEFSMISWDIGGFFRKIGEETVL